MLTQLNTHIGLCKLAIAQFTKYSVSPWADKNNEMQHLWQLSSLLQWVDNCNAPLSLLSLSCKYEFKKFSQELTLYTSNCESVDRICIQKLVQEIFLEISPSLRVFIVQDFGLWVKIFGTMISPSQLLTTLLWKKWMEAYGIILAGLIITIKHDSISKFILYIYACLLRAGIMIIWNRQLFTSLDCQNSMWGIRGFHVMASNSQPRDVTQI